MICAPMRASLFLLAGTVIAAPTVKWGNIPLSFEPNRGQAPEAVRYLARGSRYTLYLTGIESVLAAHDSPALKTTFPGANSSPAIAGEAPQASTSNYFHGNNSSKWQASVPNYERVRYVGVYPGIDLVYYGKDGHLEYDWIVAPGADPSAIRMAFADRVRIDPSGDLVIRAGNQEYRHKRPAVYQEIAGKRTSIAGRWTLHGKIAGFQVGSYDRRKELVIDPPLIYSTYHGGNSLD